MTDVLGVVVVGEGPYDLAPLVGVPALVRAVRALLVAGVVGDVTVCVQPHRRADAARVCAGLPVRYADPDGLDAVAGLVLMHEAIRPLAPVTLVRTVVDAVLAGQVAVVPVLPLTDTVKQVGSDGEVRGAPDRATLRVVQAPVAFRAGLPAVAPCGALDLVRMCAAAGEPVCAVPGDPAAFPLRTPWDLQLAQLMVADGVSR